MESEGSFISLDKDVYEGKFGVCFVCVCACACIRIFMFFFRKFTR